MPYILRIEGNYADEFDVSSVHEVTEMQAQFLIGTSGKCFSEKGKEYYFGSNEMVQVSDLEITLDHVDEYELAVLRSILSPNSSTFRFGLIDLTDFIDEAMNPEEE